MAEVTWEDLERQSSAQLPLPSLTSAPTVAERAFLTLAREWQELAGATPASHPLPRAADVVALAGLLLAVEWGSEFSAVATGQIATNRLVATNRASRSWMDQLSWDLCEASRQTSPGDTQAIQALAANLDHGNSSIRIWMMEIGWFVRSWLRLDEAIRRLLTNLGTTISEPFMAAGLAVHFFDSTDDFLAFARSQAVPTRYEKQYHERLNQLERSGILEAQAPFWQLECQCRRAIEQVSLGLRLSREAG